MREILVAVTFRDFTGDTNSKNQRAFLQSLKQQTYKNFKLIVTIYREKNVESVLKEYGLPYRVYYSKQEVKLFSWTEVISNAFAHLKKGKSILIWTNADIVYDHNYFEEIIRNFRRGYGGTSYPNMHYFSLEDKNAGKLADPYYNRYIKSLYQYDPNVYISESIFIDGDLMLNKINRDVFLEYYMSDPPGIAILPTFGFFADRLINLLYKSKINVIKSSMETGYHLLDEQDTNREKMYSLCRKRGLKKTYIKDGLLISRKLCQHKEYKILGDPLQKLAYKIYMFYYSLFIKRRFILWVVIRDYIQGKHRIGKP